MPPKARFTRDAIIDAAFRIASAEGLEAITARKIAEVLGCSVAPLYANFETLENLVAAVIEKIETLSGEILASSPGRDLFERIGRASLAFARDYPVLFRDLVLKPNPHLESFEKSYDNLAGILAADPALGRLGSEERRRLFLKTQIFQTGLQVMIANGLTPSWLGAGEEDELLMEAGQELLGAALRNNKKQRKED